MCGIYSYLKTTISGSQEAIKCNSHMWGPLFEITIVGTRIPFQSCQNFRILKITNALWQLRTSEILSSLNFTSEKMKFLTWILAWISRNQMAEIPIRSCSTQIVALQNPAKGLNLYIQGVLVLFVSMLIILTLF